MKKILIALAAVALAVPAIALASGSPSSISIAAQPMVVTYQSNTTTSGTVSSHQSGLKLSVLDQPCGTTGYKVLSQTTTSTNGAWSKQSKPVMRTRYMAKVKNTTSPAVTINVKPRIGLAKLALGKFKVRLYAAKSFASKTAVFQRWNPSGQRWMLVRYVGLKFIANGASPTIISGLTFKATIAAGHRVRIVLPAKQAASCYVGGYSSSIKS